MANAARKARASGEKKIAARDIRKVTLVRSGPCKAQIHTDSQSQVTLRKFRG